uniref:Lipase maturation factor n=1 Tax=Astyanax mexicanus TaxID=7994 RepID=A0A3B1IWV8_ASTMX
MRKAGRNMAACSDSESSESVLRRRRTGKQRESSAGDREEPGVEVPLQTGTYWLTRILLLRSISFIYCVAFAVAYNQNKQLIGQRGLMPSREYLRSVKRYVGGKIGAAALAYTPSILWFLDWEDMDTNLDGIALAGMALSGFVLLSGRANMIIMAALWILYHSITSWESQLLETGFLGIFLCPLWSLDQMPRRCPPSLISIWTLRWLIVRIMLGAGLIKIRGDRCWRDLTCMDYHYETQPVPNPISYYLHHSPWWFHRFETLSNHFIELIVPFFTFMGRHMCMVNGVLQILFQVVLIISGNLSFLNWLTIVPSIACFDDSALAFLFRPTGGPRKTLRSIQAEDTAEHSPPPTKGVCVRVVNVALGVLIAYLSVPVVINLLSPRQVMNTSFDPLRIVNTYGAFGRSVCLSVLLCLHVCTFFSVCTSVCFCLSFSVCPLLSVYHFNLLCFSVFSTYEQNEWVIQIAGRLLANDSTVLSLLGHNPFEGREKPRWIRGEHYRYKFTRPGSSSAAQGKWWARKRIGPYFPPLNLEGLRSYFKSRNWPQPDRQ